MIIPQSPNKHMKKETKEVELEVEVEEVAEEVKVEVKEAKEVKKTGLTGVVAINNGYAIMVDGEVKKEFLGGEAFNIATKEYKQSY